MLPPSATKTVLASAPAVAIICLIRKGKKIDLEREKTLLLTKKNNNNKITIKKIIIIIIIINQKKKIVIILFFIFCNGPAKKAA
jgi:hypothetical protein